MFSLCKDWQWTQRTKEYIWYSISVRLLDNVNEVKKDKYQNTLK